MTNCDVDSDAWYPFRDAHTGRGSYINFIIKHPGSAVSNQQAGPANTNMRPSFISILLIAISTVCALPVAPDDNAPGPPPAKGSLPPDDDAKVATPAPSNSDARSRPPADFYNARPPVSDSSRGDYLYESTRPGAKRLPASLRQALRGAALQDARLRHRPPARGPLLYQPNRQASGGHNAQGRPLAEPAPPGNNAQGRSQALFKPVLPSNNGQGGSVAKPLAALPGNNAQETGYLLPNSAGAAEEPPIDKTFPDPAELQRLMENVSTCCHFTRYELTPMVDFRRYDHPSMFLNQANGKYSEAPTRTH